MKFGLSLYYFQFFNFTGCYKYVLFSFSIAYADWVGVIFKYDENDFSIFKFSTKKNKSLLKLTMWTIRQTQF
jgi:hypothetical protein